MEEGEVLFPKPRTAGGHFAFKPSNKREPDNADEAICKIFCKKVPVKNAYATNLKQLQTHHPQQYAELFPNVQSH